MQIKRFFEWVLSLPAIFVLHFWFMLILVFPVLFIVANSFWRGMMCLMLVWQYCPLPNKARVRWYRCLAELMAPWKYFPECSFSIEDPQLKKYHESLSSPPRIHNYITDQQLKGHLFCLHPHGAFCYGAGIQTLNPENSIFYQCPGVASRMTTAVPFSGMIHLLHGNFGANQSQFLRLMKQKVSFILYPGGFEEAALTRYQEERVFIKDRKGFVKYAIQNDYQLHPCYQFGETSLYFTLQHDTMSNFLSRLKLVSIIVFGRFLLFPISSVRMKLVIGQRVDYTQHVKDCAHPTKDEIEKVHSLYIQELQRIFYLYRDEYAPGKDLEVK